MPRRLPSFITTNTLPNSTDWRVFMFSFLLFINFNFYSHNFVSELSSQMFFISQSCNNLNNQKTYFLPKAKTMSCEKGILEFEEVECISVENSQSVNYIGHIAYHNVIMIIKFNYSCKSKVHSFFDKNDLAAIMMVIVITLAEYCCPIKKQMMLFLLWEYFAAFYFVSIHNHTCVKWFI